MSEAVPGLQAVQEKMLRAARRRPESPAALRARVGGGPLASLAFWTLVNRGELRLTADLLVRRAPNASDH